MKMSTDRNSGVRTGTSTRDRKLTSLLLIVIIAASGTLAVGVFQYSNLVSASITNSSQAAVRSNAQTQVNNIAELLTNQIGQVASNMVIASESLAVQRGDILEGS